MEYGTHSLDYFVNDMLYYCKIVVMCYGYVMVSKVLRRLASRVVGTPCSFSVHKFRALLKRQCKVTTASSCYSAIQPFIDSVCAKFSLFILSKHSDVTDYSM